MKRSVNEFSRRNSVKGDVTSKLRQDAKKVELKNDYSGQTYKKATILSKIEKIAGSKQVDPFKKLDKEIVILEEKLSMLYRSPELKKSFKLRKAIMDTMRHTNSVTGKLKTYQRMLGKRKLEGIISSFNFQIAKLNSTIVNLEKDVEKVQQVECAATAPLDNLLQYGTKLCSRKEPFSNLRTENSTKTAEINWEHRYYQKLYQSMDSD